MARRGHVAAMRGHVAAMRSHGDRTEIARRSHLQLGSRLVLPLSLLANPFARAALAAHAAREASDDRRGARRRRHRLLRLRLARRRRGEVTVASDRLLFAGGRPARRLAAHARLDGGGGSLLLEIGLRLLRHRRPLRLADPLLHRHRLPPAENQQHHRHQAAAGEVRLPHPVAVRSLRLQPKARRLHRKMR